MLGHLILNDMMKVKGNIARIALRLVDEEEEVGVCVCVCALGHVRVLVWVWMGGHGRARPIYAQQLHL